MYVVVVEIKKENEDQSINQTNKEIKKGKFKWKSGHV